MEKEEYEKRIRELEKRLKKLEAKSGSGPEPEGIESDESIGSAASILESIGESFGLGGLIKSVSKMPEFQDRLSRIDDELRTKLRETPLKRSTRVGVRGIPPAVGTRGPRATARPPKEEPPPEPSRQVDIFDEDDHVLVVCEIPGSEDEKIAVKLNKDKLSITAETFHRKGGTFQKELVLPYVPEGELSQSYKNGILRIKIFKENE